MYLLYFANHGENHPVTISPERDQATTLVNNGNTVIEDYWRSDRYRHTGDAVLDMEDQVSPFWHPPLSLSRGCHWFWIEVTKQEEAPNAAHHCQ